MNLKTDLNTLPMTLVSLEQDIGIHVLAMRERLVGKPLRRETKGAPTSLSCCGNDTNLGGL